MRTTDKEIKHGYGVREKRRIAQCFLSASEKAKNHITAVVLDAAPHMIDDLPCFAVDKRKRREDIRNQLLSLAGGFLLHTEEMCKLLERASIPKPCSHYKLQPSSTLSLACLSHRQQCRKPKLVLTSDIFIPIAFWELMIEYILEPAAET